MTPRPLRAVVRLCHGPAPLDFDHLAARCPAVRPGPALADEADLELLLACTGPGELHAVVAELRRAGATRIRVEPVLRAVAPAPVPAAPPSPPSPLSPPLRTRSTAP
ncbi:hypothetical protein [Streptomyces sp. NRRL B-24484]|uniref:hypothetical protein n=1 Tax=Streptomyces sp. NRRL B-24484 TaxID=1463833 RepID=UPI0004C27B8F|nr:hypothetical protein [Streptomyces sp. NRRL B-24484]